MSRSCPPGPRSRNVWSARAALSLDQLRKHNGTATLRPASAPAQTGVAQIPVRTLAEVLRDHPRFHRPRLIKTDTDGADFDILLSSLDLIAARRPILYFEYKPDIRQNGIAQSIQTITELQAAGYTRFLVYDNFGNYLETVEHDAAERFRDLNRFLLSHAIFGRRDIHYLDVCAFGRTTRIWRSNCGIITGGCSMSGSVRRDCRPEGR